MEVIKHIYWWLQDASFNFWICVYLVALFFCLYPFYKKINRERKNILREED
jgi:hypothetical protein